MENTEKINVTEAELAEVYTARPLTDRLRYKVQSITEQASAKQEARQKARQTRRKVFALAGVAAGVGVGVLSYPTLTFAYTLEQMKRAVAGVSMLHMTETQISTDGKEHLASEAWFASNESNTTYYRNRQGRSESLYNGKHFYEWETDGKVIRKKNIPFNPPKIDFTLSYYLNALQAPLGKVEFRNNVQWKGQQVNIALWTSTKNQKMVFYVNPKTNQPIQTEIQEPDGTIIRSAFDFDSNENSKIFAVEAIGKPIIDADQEKTEQDAQLEKGIGFFAEKPDTVIHALEVNKYGDVFIVYSGEYAKENKSMNEINHFPSNTGQENRKFTYIKPVDPIEKAKDNQNGEYMFLESSMGRGWSEMDNPPFYATQLKGKQLHGHVFLRTEEVGSNAFPKKITLSLSSGKSLTLTVTKPTCEIAPENLGQLNLFEVREFEYTRLWHQAMIKVDKNTPTSQIEKAIPRLQLLIQMNDKKGQRSDGYNITLAFYLKRVGRIEEAKALEAQLPKMQ
jgi:hypothetical protein